MDLLHLRLYGYLSAAHVGFGLPHEPLTNMLDFDDVEIHPLGRTGAIAFIGDYVLTAWPDDEMRACCRDAYRILGSRLEARGFTRHMVHPLNFPSVKLTRKLGAIPVGVDSDGFVHYILTKYRFIGSKHHGQEVATAQAA
jgi:hypothetical protein